MKCPYCHTEDCDLTYDELGQSNPGRICRKRSYDAHHFEVGDKVTLREYDDEFCQMYEEDGENPPPGLVALERERKTGTVKSVSSMYPGSDQVTVEVDGHETILWNKYLLRTPA